jgi:hypothetical protein
MLDNAYIECYAKSSVNALDSVRVHGGVFVYDELVSLLPADGSLMTFDDWKKAIVQNGNRPLDGSSWKAMKKAGLIAMEYNRDEPLRVRKVVT